MARWRVFRGEDVNDMARARSWRDLRADAIESGHVSEDGIADARSYHDEQNRAYRLRQLRKARMARQEDVAAVMNVSQSRISRIESGDIEHAELARCERTYRR